MKLTAIGTGFVGLVTGKCFANSGNAVICVDINEKIIESLKQGKVPIFEARLSVIVFHNNQHHRLRFTTDTVAAVADAELICLAVAAAVL